MTTHHPRHREGSRVAAALLFSYLTAARAVLADIGAVAGVLCALGILPLAAAQPPAASTSSAVALNQARTTYERFVLAAQDADTAI